MKCSKEERDLLFRICNDKITELQREIHRIKKVMDKIFLEEDR